MTLTPEGAARARGYDKTFYANVVGGYDSPVDDWMVSGKLTTSNFLFGFQTYRQMESAGIPLVDTFAATGGERLPLDAGAHVGLREVLAALPRRTSSRGPSSSSTSSTSSTGPTRPTSTSRTTSAGA